MIISDIRETPARGRKSDIFDLSLSGDTLVVPRFNDNTVVFYQLMYDKVVLK